MQSFIQDPKKPLPLGALLENLGTFYWKELRMQGERGINGVVAAGIISRGPDTMCGIFWKA